jgi:hypothetical protein
MASLNGKQLIALLGHQVEGTHPQLGRVCGELKKLDVYTILAAIADPRFVDSPVLKDGHKEGLISLP